MFVAPVPIAVSFYCVFSPPVGLEGYGLFAWFLGWSISLRTFMTVYHVPHLAMGGELAKNYTERTKILSYNNFFTWLGGGGVFKFNTMVFFVVVGTAGNSLINPDNYPSLCHHLVIGDRGCAVCFRLVHPGSHTDPPATTERFSTIFI